MPVYHYSDEERRASDILKEQSLEEMVVDDPLLVLEIKKILKANRAHGMHIQEHVYGSGGTGDNNFMN